MPAYLLMDVIVDDYMPMLDDFSDRLDELETQVFENFQPKSTAKDVQRTVEVC